MKNANRIGERGEPCASPAFTSGVGLVRKSLNPILVWRSLIKLAIYFLAVVGILLARRQASRLILLTLLKASFRLNATSVTTLCLYHVWSIALERTRRACLVVLSSRPLNWVSGSRLCFSARYDSCYAITASRSLSSVLRSEIGR